MKKKGQILLITLLVITILSILTVSAIVFATKDIKQVAQNNQYNQSYNVAENQLQRILSSYSDPKKSLIGGTTNLTNDPLFYSIGKSSCIQNLNITNPIANTEVDCTFNTDRTFSSFPTISVVKVTDTKDLLSYTILKDQALDINLSNSGSGYSNGINISWIQPNIALDIAYTYLDATGNYKTIRDVYDYNGSLFNLKGTYVITPSGTHPFSYSLTPQPGTSTIINLNLSTIPGYLSSVGLRITPRMSSGISSDIFNITPTTYTNYPAQIRTFNSSTYNANDNVSPIAQVVSKINLFGQPNYSFDYGLISN